MVNIDNNRIYTSRLEFEAVNVSKILIILSIIDIKLKIFYTSNVVDNY